MQTVSLCQFPRTLQSTAVSSSDTNAIELAAAAEGKVTRLWGWILTGGTSVVVKSDSTALSGAIAPPLSNPPPTGNRADSAYPLFESAVGEALSITPGASGLKGVVYWTQD